MPFFRFMNCTAHMMLSHKSLGNQHVSVVRFLLHIMISYRTPNLRSAVRYCGATFTFTSVSILLNYSTWSDLSLASLWRSKYACSSDSTANYWPCKWCGAEHSLSRERFWTSPRWLRKCVPSLDIIPFFSDATVQMWSAAVQGDPSGYYIGFVVVAAACALAVVHSFFIR